MRRGKAESTPSPPLAVATAELQETIFLDKAVEEEGAIWRGLTWRALRPWERYERGTAAFGR